MSTLEPARSAPHDDARAASAGGPAARVEPVCPACHGPLERRPDGRRCGGCGAEYPRRANVDVLLAEDEWRDALAHLEEERPILEQYVRARREAALNILYYDHWVARMLAEIPPGHAGPVLELMCGGAEICRRLPRRLRPAVALDLNVAMVEQAAADLARMGRDDVTVLCGTAARLPLPDASMGVVLVQGGFHHAKPLLPVILAEVARVLRPDGLLIASEPANDFWLVRRVRHWQYAHSPMQGHDPGEDGFTQPELDAALRDAGLRLERYRRCGYVAYPLIGNTDVLPVLARSRARWLGNALLGIDRALEHVPVIGGMGWISIFRGRRTARP
jgi:SAM-dependent methyltransferase